jgi:hypothetical protein
MPNFPCGLYLDASKGNAERPCGCKLLLPFGLTPHRWVRYGDGNQLEEWFEYEGLFNPGWPIFPSDNPFTLRLELLLMHWTYMIENELREVGETGVLGGIEKFKEANTEEKWAYYWIRATS